MDRRLSPECLANKTSTKCVLWTGPDYPELDIKSGDSLEYVLDRIVASLGRVAQEEHKDVSLGGLAVNSNPCASHITERRVHLADNITNGLQHFGISNDAIASNLPEAYYISGARVSVFTAEGVNVVQSSQPNINVPMKITDYPLMVDYTLFLNTPCGPMTMAGATSVQSGTDVKILKLEVAGTASHARKPVDVSDALRMLGDEVAALKNRM